MDNFSTRYKVKFKYSKSNIYFILSTENVFPFFDNSGLITICGYCRSRFVKHLEATQLVGTSRVSKRFLWAFTKSVFNGTV